MTRDMSPSKTLYAVVCAAGPARDVGNLVQLAQQRNWSVQVVSTPSALSWLDVPALEAQTKRPVRSATSRTGCSSRWPGRCHRSGARKLQYNQ